MEETARPPAATKTAILSLSSRLCRGIIKPSIEYSWSAPPVPRQSRGLREGFARKTDYYVFLSSVAVSTLRKDLCTRKDVAVLPWLSCL